MDIKTLYQIGEIDLLDIESLKVLNDLDLQEDQQTKWGELVEELKPYSLDPKRSESTVQLRMKLDHEIEA